MLPLSLSVAMNEDIYIQQKAIMALNVYAHKVLNEGNVENEVLRKEQANRIIQTGEEYLKPFVSSILASNAIQFSEVKDLNDITDEMFMEGVAEVWNGLVGIVG